MAAWRPHQSTRQDVQSDPPEPLVGATTGDAMPGLERDVPLPAPDENGTGPPIALVRGSDRVGVGSETHEPRFELWTAAELADIPTPTWLWEGHLTAGGLSVVYGPPGHLKTFFTIHVGLCIGTGTPCFGRSTTWGPFVLVCTEGGWGLTQRIRAWQDAHEIADLTAAYFVREPVNLLEEAQVSAFLADLEHGIPTRPQLITFDTLHGSMTGGDENLAADMGRVIDSCRRISRTTGAHVQLIHHMSKDARWERGSISLRAASDAMFKLEYEDGVLTVTNDKQRDAAPLDPYRLRLVPVGPSCVVEPFEGPIEPGTLSNRGRDALRTLIEVGESSATVWLKSAKIPEPSFYRTIKVLIDGGYVSKVKGRYAVTDLGRAALNGYSQ